MIAQRARAPHVLARALLTALALVVLAPAALVVAAGFLPDEPAIGRFGVFLNASLLLVLALAVLATVLSGLAVALGGRRVTLVLLAGCLLVSAGALVVAYRFASVAAEHGAQIDWLASVRARDPAPAADAHLTYATVDGAPLRAAVWRPRTGEPAPSAGRAALMFVHGGAFVGGGLGERPALFASLAEAGWVVLDVEYRLSPPVRWDQAPGDVLCALAWVPSIAAELEIDPTRVVLMGESAGGSLALLAGYAAGTDRLDPSCPELGPPVIPAGVIAIAPAADLAGIWEDATLVAAERRFPEAYVGGTPDEFPDRYELASPFRLIRADLPPTLLLAGENDHLVRLRRVTSIADRLSAAGADVRLLIVPFVDHGFDGDPNGFGGQLEERVVADFIRRITG